MRLILSGYGPARTTIETDHEVEIHEPFVGPILYHDGGALGICARDDGFELTYLPDGRDADSEMLFAVSARGVELRNANADPGTVTIPVPDDGPLVGVAQADPADYVAPTQVGLLDSLAQVQADQAERMDTGFVDEADDLQSAIFQALGAASTCWENLNGAGVFDSDRAKAIGDALLERVVREFSALPDAVAVEIGILVDTVNKLCDMAIWMSGSDSFGPDTPAGPHFAHLRDTVLFPAMDLVQRDRPDHDADGQPNPTP